MITVKRIGHATFETRDIERQIEYYQQLVGLRLAERDAKRAYLATGVGQLAVILEAGAQERCRALSFEVPLGADRGEMQRHLTAAGIACESRSDATPGISTVLTLADPKGTTIELFSDWNFVETSGPAGGAGPVKLGHVAFVVPSPQATTEFYQRVLGFRVSDWIGDYFSFLRCGVDHHTVNFLRGDGNRMHHIAFELRDAAHLHDACDLLGEQRIPIIWGPVRHGPGHNVAIYHRNPGNQIIEFFIELDRMHDEERGYFEPRPWHRDRPQKPKVWDGKLQRDMWGLPPSADFLRAEN